jgi:hypothetical protein
MPAKKNHTKRPTNDNGVRQSSRLRASNSRTVEEQKSGDSSDDDGDNDRDEDYEEENETGDGEEDEDDEDDEDDVNVRGGNKRKKSKKDTTNGRNCSGVAGASGAVMSSGGAGDDVVVGAAGGGVDEDVPPPPPLLPALNEDPPHYVFPDATLPVRPHIPVRMVSNTRNPRQEDCSVFACTRQCVFMCLGCNRPMCFQLPTPSGNNPLACFYRVHNITLGNVAFLKPPKAVQRKKPRGEPLADVETP